MKTIRIHITTTESELLDALLIDVPKGHRFIAVRPVTHSIGSRADEQIAEIGDLP